MVQAFLHKIHQVQSISTISFIAKLQKSLEPNFAQILALNPRIGENSFAAQTIIVRPLCISDRYLVLAQQILNWCTFDFSVGSPNYIQQKRDAFTIQQNSYIYIEYCGGKPEQPDTGIIRH